MLEHIISLTNMHLNKNNENVVNWELYAEHDFPLCYKDKDPNHNVSVHDSEGGWVYYL